MVLSLAIKMHTAGAEVINDTENKGEIQFRMAFLNQCEIDFLNAVLEIAKHYETRHSFNYYIRK